MINHYDIAYGLGVGLTAPFWLAKSATRRKVMGAFAQRMGRVPARDPSRRAVMIHAVSLGEINATRSLVDLLRLRRPGLDFIVTVTTETGFARGKELYGAVGDVTLVRYPLDFSVAVDRMLNALRPDVVALLELEVWPNFIRRCVQRHVPVLLINGRITAGSFRKYRVVRALIGAMFSRLHRVAVQDATYARRFIELGVSAQRVSVTGTMKFDNAAVVDHVSGQEELAAAVGLLPGKEPIWVCGSTGPGEESQILGQYRQLLGQFPELRLVIVPRKPERFDEVAHLIVDAGYSVIRRSRPQESVAPGAVAAVVLGDTIGELRKLYAMADVIFVGRTLVDLGSRQHGSDMIEPAALAKPIIVGPFTANFAEAMNRFGEAEAMLVVQTPEELGRAVSRLLTERGDALAMAGRARAVVRQEQGATEKHVTMILEALDSVLTS